MDDAARQLAKRLFDEAISAGTPDPAAWTATQTENREVIAEVRRLLGQHGAHATHSDAHSTAAPVRLADPLLAATLGTYKIDRLLGVGGMGRVYLATSTGPDAREVALKVLSRGLTGSIALQRFQREADVMQKLRHPSIASFHASGMYDDGEGAVPWFAMEFIADAVALGQWCEQRNLALRDRVSLVAQITDAIGYAHRLGIVHRDLKPANVLVNRGGEVKIIDFGVARCVGDDSGLAAVRTQTGQLVGTMQYMSPEQFEGDPRKVDQRADVYAVGVILYELLSGTFPHDVRTLPVVEAARMVCSEEAQDIRNVLPECDPALASIVAQCLARSRESRFSDATAVSDALGGWLRGDSAIELGPDGSAERSERRAKAGFVGASASSHSHRGIETTSIRRSSGWLVPVFSLVLVAAVALVATGTLTPEQVFVWWQSTQARFGGGASGGGRTAPSSYEESITVESEPAGAQVTIDGRALGVTPCRAFVVWTQSSTGATVVITKDGFRRETVVVAAAPRGGRTAPLKVAVRLVPASVPTHP